MRNLTALLAGGALMLAASGAMAATLDALLDREVASAPSYSVQKSLQSQLDQVFQGKLSAATDDLGIGFFFPPAEGSRTYYTLDSLNPGGEARVLAFDGSRAGIPNGGILFAYEDGGDFDYQDMGMFVESITPVPEPGTLLLFGAGFLGLAIYGKRRRKRLTC